MSGRFKPGSTEVQHAHPLVRQMLALRLELQMPYPAISRRSGIGTRTMKAWRRHNVPSIANFEAALNAMGYRLAIVPMETTNAR